MLCLSTFPFVLVTVAVGGVAAAAAAVAAVAAAAACCWCLLLFAGAGVVNLLHGIGREHTAAHCSTLWAQFQSCHGPLAITCCSTMWQNLKENRRIGSSSSLVGVAFT